MNTKKKLICILTAGAALGAAAPVFADSYRDRGYDNARHGAQYHDDRHGYNDHDRRWHRDHDRHVVVERPRVVQRTYVVERPVYYGEPAPESGIGAIIGAAIGSIIDNQR